MVSKDTDTATGDHDVELIMNQISASICCLDDHGFAGEGGGGECEMVARAALSQFLVILSLFLGHELEACGKEKTHHVSH